MKFFGFEIKKSKEQQQNQTDTVSIVSPDNMDGAIETVAYGTPGFFSNSLDIGGSIRTENDLIDRYRQIAMYPEVDTAIKEIVSEAISHDTDDNSVSCDIKNEKISEEIQEKIVNEFNNIVDLFDFNAQGESIFERWYVDGRIYYQIILNKDNTEIQELRYIDPKKIRKVREMAPVSLNSDAARSSGSFMSVKVADEYFAYSPDGITENSGSQIKLSSDSVIFVPSGLFDPNQGIVVGYINKAIKTANQLKLLEDAMLIYRISRAPERFVFKVDTGNLPAQKAEQYMAEVMNRYRNKIEYDASTGEVRDDRRNMAVTEDFWIPTRNGSGTDISTVGGGMANQSIDDIQYFREKVYRSLNIPIGRLQQNAGFNLGKASEITRDEIKFAKFIDRLRYQFSKLFIHALKVQCIAKGIVTPDEWNFIEKYLKINYARDNYFFEFKTNEILQQRIEMVGTLDPYVGKYFSTEYIRKEILRFTDEEIFVMDKQIANEQSEKPESSEEQPDTPAPSSDNNPFAPLNPDRVNGDSPSPDKSTDKKSDDSSDDLSDLLSDL
jgi:hypothetical protein